MTDTFTRIFLKGEEKFFADDGFPKRPTTNGWKGEHGLYAVGLTRKGLLGASMDARNIAEDIRKAYDTRNLVSRASEIL